MLKVSEENMRRALDLARNSGLKIDDAARAFVMEGESAEFYLGFLSGIRCAVTLSRCFLQRLSEAADSVAHHKADEVASLYLIGEAVEIITMGFAGPAAVSAERCLEVQNLKSQS